MISKENRNCRDHADDDDHAGDDEDNDDEDNDDDDDNDDEDNDDDDGDILGSNNLQTVDRRTVNG